MWLIDWTGFLNQYSEISINFKGVYSIIQEPKSLFQYQDIKLLQYFEILFCNICLYHPQYPFKCIFWCSGCDRHPPKAFICVKWWYRLLPFPIFFFVAETHTHTTGKCGQEHKICNQLCRCTFEISFRGCRIYLPKVNSRGGRTVSQPRLRLTLQLFLAKNRRAKCAYFQYDAVSITVKIILPRLLGFPIQFPPTPIHFSRNSNVSR